ncbi:MAG TPA: DsbA family protein [Methylovirgula sp.]|jgi:protein-disulfide isomerase
MFARGLRLVIASCAFAILMGAAYAQQQQLAPGLRPEDLSRDALLNDPDAPVIGNPNGDLTIVAFEDYNCPFCKKSDPELRQLVKNDGHIKLLYKDWPILADTSLYGAELALAAKYEGKYETVHDALMDEPASESLRKDQTVMDMAVAKAGVDLTQLKKDLGDHIVEIGTLLQRNNAQATFLHFSGTPIFLIGPYLIAGAPDYNGFKKVVAKARAQNKH